MRENSVFSRARFKVLTQQSRGDRGGYGADMKMLAIAMSNTEK